MECLGKSDPRVEARGVHLFERMVATGTVVLRTLGGTRAGEVAAQRWLSSPRITTEQILEASSVRTVSACAGRRVVAAQDTTAISFTRSAARRGLGPGGNGTTPGFFLHPVVAVDIEEEAVLGLVGARIWTRGIGEKARKTIAVVRSGTIRVARPASAAASDPIELELGLVEVREAVAPAAGIEPVLWRLLTTLPVEGSGAACEIVHLYRLRCA